MKVDYIIVGQGIAGSLLAYFLTQSGQHVMVIDKATDHSASRVAAGIINPVTGKRLVKSWKIDEILPFAKQTYSQLEQRLGIRLLKSYELIKLFSNSEDAGFYEEKRNDPALKEFIEPLDVTAYNRFFRNISLGGVSIKQSLQLDFNSLLNGIKKWLNEKNAIQSEAFDYQQIRFIKDEVAYKNFQAKKIIFCEGNRAVDNPYFKWLPFNLAKGEILTVHIKDFPEDKIWNKGMFILPLGEGVFKVGTTYEWDFKNAEPTEAAKEDIAAKLEKIISLPFEILDHQAAIRPTVKDRRPFLGLHPEYPQLAIFNGLGTKGASLGPYFASQMSEFLLSEKVVDEEVDIARFY